ncbi:MAG TPA: hypothetical protein VH744_13625, partial [Terriglobales bacterium]
MRNLFLAVSLLLPQTLEDRVRHLESLHNINVCGNGVKETIPAEVCDGADLAGETCQTQGFDSGALACAPGCAAFDTNAC